MSQEYKGHYFEDMSRDLLGNLGYKIVKERHGVNEKHDHEIDLCVNFESDIFLKPKYSPPGLTFIECKATHVSDGKGILQLYGNIARANKEEKYTKRLGGKITGGILLGETFSHPIVDRANEKGYYCWDIHRVFFFAMKIFAHSMLENWVSESKLGFVLREEELKKQFEPDHYYTTLLVGIRYSELNSRLEVYFTYYTDCLMDPFQSTRGMNSLTTEHVKLILDDVYSKLKWVSEEIYPGCPKKVTVEIHSLSGFTADAEYNAKLYAQSYKKWKELNVELSIDEHTLFKYSIIPWEAVMDYAFTKRTREHTTNYDGLQDQLKQVEINFLSEFKEAIKKQVITGAFTDKKWQNFKNLEFRKNESLFNAKIVDDPIKQLLIFFARSSIKGSKIEGLKKLVSEIKEHTKYNYVWIGIMSGSGFTEKEVEYVQSFKESGIGVGLIDAVTKSLTVNKSTVEGRNLNLMFLTECVS